MAADLIDVVDDVYYLTCDEVVTMPADARLRIKRRRAERDRLQVQRPADVIDGAWTPVDESLMARVRAGRQRSTEQVGQRRLRIGQLVGIDRSLGPDQGFDVVEHVPDVDVHPGQHSAVAVEPERDELTAGDVAAEHHPVVARAACPTYSMPRSYWSVKK